MKVAVVSGTRTEVRRGEASAWLAEHGPWDFVVHGGCPVGVDAEADEWAQRHKIQTVRVPANWPGFGRPAGPIRNRALARLGRMLLDGGGDVRCSAFPAEGTGTQSAIDCFRAEGLSIEVKEWKR